MHTVTSRDGTPIAYDRVGNGPALILVDGATAHRAYDAACAAALAPFFTVHAYDRRGRGDSGDTAPYAPAREVEDIAALIQAAGGEAFVFGHSSGGALALDAAAAGLTIPKLAVYEPPFVVDDSRPPLPADYVDRLNALVADGRRGDALKLFMTAAVGIPAEYLSDDAPDPASEAVAHTLAYDGAIMGTTMSGRLLPTGRWAAVTMPVLVMTGGDSDPYFHTGGQALSDLLPDARREVYAGQNHGIADEVLVPALRAFFLRA